MSVPEYDVCLSFAGEDRPYVEQVASCLAAAGVKVFYDSFEEIELWGKNLYQYLSDIYSKKARFCVVFASEAYSKKLWARHELAAAQARAFRETGEFILPARFDDADIPGLLETIGYLDLRKLTPKEFADSIVRKLGTSLGRVITLHEFRQPGLPNASVDEMYAASQFFEWVLGRAGVASFASKSAEELAKLDTHVPWAKFLESTGDFLIQLHMDGMGSADWTTVTHWLTGRGFVIDGSDFEWYYTHPAAEEYRQQIATRYDRFAALSDSDRLLILKRHSR